MKSYVFNLPHFAVKQNAHCIGHIQHIMRAKYIFQNLATRSTTSTNVLALGKVLNQFIKSGNGDGSAAQNFLENTIRDGCNSDSGKYTYGQAPYSNNCDKSITNYICPPRPIQKMTERA